MNKIGVKFDFQSDSMVKLSEGLINYDKAKEDENRKKGQV